MNCCNEFGECRQGRDCPARTHAQHHEEQPDSLTWRNSLAVVALHSLAIVVVILASLAMLEWLYAT